MKEFIALFVVSLGLAIILAKIFGFDFSSARAIADWIITCVLIALVIPFVVMRIKENREKRSKK